MEGKGKVINSLTTIHLFSIQPSVITQLLRVQLYLASGSCQPSQHPTTYLELTSPLIGPRNFGTFIQSIFRSFRFCFQMRVRTIQSHLLVIFTCKTTKTCSILSRILLPRRYGRFLPKRRTYASSLSSKLK